MSRSFDLDTLRTLLEYTDWSNDRLLAAAGEMSDEQLDRDMQIGVGGMRRTLLHIYNGEYVWFQRWKGGPSAETPWPSEAEKATVRDLAARFAANRRERDAFLSTLHTPLGAEQRYRDSRGDPFLATLGDELVQAIMHSKHHQAQAVNIIRRLGLGLVELDYMMRVRRPEQAGR